MNEIKYMVIGNPVRHSLSPVMQNVAFDFFGEGEPYSFRELELNDLSAFVEFAKANLKGFNVTAPYKQEIMKYCQVINEEAEEAGSVNTVKIICGKLYGYTTDGFGFLEAMRTVLKIDPSGKRFTLLGAGGAAWAIAQTLNSEGAKEINIVNRTLSKALELAEKVGGKAYEWSELEQVLDADCVINCTALGLREEDESPLTSGQMDKVNALFDTVYLPTKLQKLAREKNIKIADGRMMLLNQGARSFEIWTGHAAPVVKMQLALYQAVEGIK